MAQDWSGHHSVYPDDTPEKGKQTEIGTAVTDAKPGETVDVVLFPAPDWNQTPHEDVFPSSIRWDPADLDRCEHGRHSIDSCFDCPEGQSHGNPYLLSAHSGQGQVRLDSGQSEIRVRQSMTGEIQVRIGTMYSGEPIWVVVRDKARETT